MVGNFKVFFRYVNFVCEFPPQGASGARDAVTIRRMSGTSDTSASAPSSGHRRLNTSLDRRSLSLAIIAIIAVTALGLAGWALLRSGSGSEQDYSDSQPAEAKTKICAVFDVVRRGVNRNTSLSVPGGTDDIAGTLAVAANARISLYSGGLYLLDRLDPATPTELADEIRGFANLLTDIGAAATAGAMDSDPDQAARLRDADAANTKLGELCSK